MSDLPTVVGELLGEARALDWRRIAIHRNMAPVPSPHPPGDFSWNRGFDFVVLGGPRSYYGRCRPDANRAGQRASGVREQLGDDAVLRDHVPWTRWHHDGRTLVEISAWVRGDSFYFVGPTLPVSRWSRALHEILDVSLLLSRRSAEILPGLRGQAAIQLAEAAQAQLRFLSGHFGEAVLGPLVALLQRARPVTPVIQHGDLWPGNVMRTTSGWVLFDYEVFGSIQVPGYDVLHFLRAALLARSPAGLTWLQALRQSGPFVESTQAALRGMMPASGLESDDLLAAVTFYLVDITARIGARRGPEEWWQPFRLDLEALSAALQDRPGLTRLLTGTAPNG